MYVVIIGSQTLFYFYAIAFSITCGECFSLFWPALPEQCDQLKQIQGFFCFVLFICFFFFFLRLMFSDPRVRGWLLLDNYLPTLAFTIMYLLIVWMGPKYMRNRQPFSCRGILVVYNLVLTFLSLYLFYEVGQKFYLKRLSIKSLNSDIIADITDIMSSE